MTEVPEHLLQRSRERRSALGGGGDAGEASSSESTAVETASGAAPAQASAAAPPRPAPTEPAFVTSAPPPPKRVARIPVWAMPALIALPLWAIVFGGAFGERPTGEGPSLGQQVYLSAGCSGCHGPNGGGGVGPALDNVGTVFPDFADHVSWVKTGSASFKGQTYGATGEVATGGMPGFADSLTEEEIVAVVCYERVTFGGEAPPPQCSTGAGVDGSTAADSADHGG
ncbi:MAG: c-type cytochrome [Acidimicrobiales bacterium]